MSVRFGISARAQAPRLAVVCLPLLLLGGCDLKGGSSEDGSARVASADALQALPQSTSAGETLGFVLVGMKLLLDRNLNGKEACPDGLQHTNREQWRAQFPTEEARQRHLDRCQDFRNRGPNCENVWRNPDVIEDPLPFRTMQGKVSYGANLDEESDGKETESSCAHEEFTSPEGERGIDNQMYRFYGCGFPSIDETDEEANLKEIANTLANRLLLEITGVDSLLTDDAVAVNLYRGKDPLLVNGAGKPTLWQSQRVDVSIVRLRGKISNGVLTTSPADVLWDGVVWERRLLIRDMSLRLKIEPTGATGLRVGYLDIPQLWESYSHFAGEFADSIGLSSAPSAYEAMHRLADGYKDPATGRCTALSSARQYQFIRAHVVHPAGEEP